MRLAFDFNVNTKEKQKTWSIFYISKCGTYQKCVVYLPTAAKLWAYFEFTK